MTSTKESDQSHDRLSELPDSLIFHILSPLGTEQVIKTCVLSKRWQFLWTDSSELRLVERSSDIAKIRSFVDFVRIIVVMCSGTHLNKFYVDFNYQQCFDSNVNLWVQFAVRNKVKDFSLHCLSKKKKNLYELPQTFYSNSSFTNLSIDCCPIAPPGGIKRGVLKSLRIRNIRLTEFVFQNILSGCPVLEVLWLSACRGVKDLKIYSPTLTTVVIKGWRNANKCDLLDISAPYVRVLSVSRSMVTRFIIGGNISSLVATEVDYRFMEDAATFSQVDSTILPSVKQSLESFCSVKELELGPWCIEISDSHNQVAAYLEDDSFDLVLHNLKTVKISGFSEAGLRGEPMLTLVQLLLKSAMVLEKMVIDAKDLTGYSSSTSYSTDFTKISLKLLSLPRLSPKAVVVVR